jgi:hypothetical protein
VAMKDALSKVAAAAAMNARWFMVNLQKISMK